MQIRKLTIDGKKCLNDFRISFHTPEHACTNILIGENGTGKSTMMETVLEILASFDSPAIEKTINYSYDILYDYAQKQVFIRKVGRDYLVVVDGSYSSGSYNQIRELLQDCKLFPKRIMSFYSGSNNKLKSLIQKMNTEYRKQYSQIMRGYFYVMENVSHYDPPQIPVRKYNFCDEHMVPIYLCAILAGHDSFEKGYLQKECHFGEIHHVDMIINLDKVERLFGGTRYEEGYPERLMAAADFIDHRFSGILRQGLKYVYSKKCYFELAALYECEADSVAILEFFEILHDLFGAQYEVYVNVSGRIVKTEDLSEGQRQLIKVLGMLGICKNEDCLILLDEPDAHMNPQWKYGIKKIMDECLRVAQNAQAIIATHDPLVVNGVDKNFIRIFEIIEGNTVVRVPTEDTAGMGIDGLLQSQYYRLQTTYDKPTSDKFRKRQLLYIKLINNEISNEEKEQLRELTLELGALPKSYTTIDFLYDDFIKVFRHSTLYHKEYLSFDEIDRRRAEINEIINGLYEAQI